MDRIPITTGTYTEMPIPTGGTESLTPSLTPLPMASNTEEDWPTPWPDGFTPTTRPTPTQGLPSTKTPAPAEVCPAPTHADAGIHFSANPQDYATQVLDSLRAEGDLAEAVAQIAQLGREIDGEFDTDEVFYSREDVTGDSVAEYIMIVIQRMDPEKDPNPYLPRHEMVLFIIGCRSENYVLQFSLLERSDYAAYSSNDGSKSPLLIADANADGIREVFYQYGFFYSPDYFLYFDVLEWNSGSFHSLITEHATIINPVNDPILEDIDGNGTLEILLTEDRSRWSNECDAGPVRDSTDILMWDGEYYQYMWTDPGIPRYRFQAAFDGDYYVTVGLFDRAETLYLQALNDSELEPFIWREWAEKFGIFCSVDWYISEPNEPLYIRAYTRLRLLELYVYLGKMKEGEVVWQYINGHRSTATEYSYASLAQVFWETLQTGNGIDAACNSVNEKAVDMHDDLFSWMVYGYQNTGPASDTICPFHSGSG